ncbi:MAG: hypothetical protein IT447_05855 [Phycisphaerales bacterium]|nr:hypothetical protein [Phycisphaerales bacterium]
MSIQYLPESDSGLRDWAANFDTLINAAPVTYGLSISQATSYGEKRSAYATALTAATDPSTRGDATILAKNIAKLSLIAISRELGQFVRSNPIVTDAQRQALGLNIRAQRAPIPAPTEAPQMDILSISGRTVSIRLHKQGSGRGKPTGVAGARLFSFVGETAPQDLRDWTFEGTDSRTKFSITLAADIPTGSRVWLTACWFNPMQECGPSCEPINTYVQYGPPTAQSAIRDSDGPISRAA